MSWLLCICVYATWLTVIEAKLHHQVGPVQDDSQGLSDKVIQDLRHEILLMKQGNDRKMEQLAQGYGRKLEQLTHGYDSKLEKLTQGCDSKLEQLTHGYDSKLEQLTRGYDSKLEQLSQDYNLMKIKTEVLDDENKKLRMMMVDHFIKHNTGPLGSFNNSTVSNKGQASVVAFLARRNGFSGDNGVQIPFDVIDLNVGNAYDITGQFTSPVSGIYHFASMIQPDVTCDPLITCAKLTINGAVLLESCGLHPTSPALTATVQLSAGDILTITFGGNCYITHNALNKNWFCGHLLYESI